MSEYVYGKWDVYWGCDTCKEYSWEVMNVCPTCGAKSGLCTARPIYKVNPWYFPNRFIGYETLAESESRTSEDK